MKNILTIEERKELRAVHRKERDRRVADRIKAVILTDQGWPYKKIAEALMLDEETISEHVDAYIKSKKLKPENGGSESWLSCEQQAQLISHLEEKIYTKAQDICAYVHSEYGILYTVPGITNLLHRIGFVYKKPKESPAKADTVQQQNFVEEYRKLKAATPENEPILFVDAVHPTMATKVSYGWIKQGYDKIIASTASRTRVNLAGAIQLSNLKTITQDFDTINAENMITFLNKVLNTFSDAPLIHVILDQSGYHRSKALREFAEQSRIRLHFLPPYSPNLNPIERLWKVMNEYVRDNRYFASAQEFRNSINYFFENTLPEIAVDLISRINDNFCIIKHNAMSKSGFSC
jgi:transposase